jgi:hypothetical protein
LRILATLARGNPPGLRRERTASVGDYGHAPVDIDRQPELAFSRSLSNLGPIEREPDLAYAACCAHEATRER